MYSILPHPSASHSSILQSQDSSIPKPGSNVSATPFFRLHQEQKHSLFEFLLFVEEELAGFMESHTCNDNMRQEEAVVLLYQQWQNFCESLQFLPTEYKVSFVSQGDEMGASLDAADVLASFLILAHQMYCHFSLESFASLGQSITFDPKNHELMFDHDDLGRGEPCVVWSKGLRLLEGPVVVKARVGSNQL